MRENQHTRYGAIAKAYPFTTGKALFLISSTEAAAGDFTNTFPSDLDGQSRVFTTWAAVITALELSTDADCVVVSPLFTTAPTLAQIASLNAAGVVTVQAGKNLPDGSYLATKAATAMLTTTTIDLFQVNGRIELLQILGEVVTSFPTLQTSKFLALPDVGSSADLAAAAATGNATVGSQFGITGTLANALINTSLGAVIHQAASVVVKAGKIQWNNIVTSTGNVKFTVRYKPIDPGAFVSAL